ncbi:armadillo-type protein [Chlamydoabsidia padenii]|nr:armadillo-type protein [Chlamydoabsidia padenii]
MTGWVPQKQGLYELLWLFADAARPQNRNQLAIQQKLESFNKIPDYPCYLVYILNEIQSNNHTRATAGLLLKNTILNHYNSIQLDVLDYIKFSCTKALQQPDSDSGVRKAVASVIAALVTRGQVHNWFDILPLLVEKLSNTDSLNIEIALDTLCKICEDATRDLDQEMHGHRPLDFILPSLIRYFDHTNASYRVRAMSATNQFVMLQSVSLFACIDLYLEALFARANDANPEVRQELCRSITMIMEARPHVLQPYMSNILDYMIHSIQDENEHVALEACDFWPICVDVEEMQPFLIPALPQIIPLLLSHMVYSDMDIMLLGGADDDYDDDNDNGDGDDTDTPVDSFTAIQQKKQTHDSLTTPTSTTIDKCDSIQTTTNDITVNDTSKSDSIGGMKGINLTDMNASKDNNDNYDDDDDDDDDDNIDSDEFYSEWTLRKCCASALESLTSAHSETVIKLLLPLLNASLFHQHWKIRESGILALGAIAEDGINAMGPHLPTLIPYLLQSMNDAKPLVRSITCWTLGRYSQWIVTQYASIDGRQSIFEPVLYNLLQRLLDKNKRVQEASCSAFATLEEQTNQELIPYLQPILINLTSAFNMYQQKNMTILYDALGTLAESVGSELNQTKCLELLMPPLIARWNNLSDQDTNLFPLLSCLSTITAALGTGFEPYAAPVYIRCVKLVASTLHAAYLADQNPHEMDPPDVEFMIFALDLLSGLIQGLGSVMAPLISQSEPKLLSLLDVCVRDPLTEVLQPTFVLIGDIATSCFEQLEPYLHSFLPDMVDQMLPDYQCLSVCNNAMWSVGEIALRWGDNIEPFIPRLMERLYPILQQVDLPDSLQENAMVTLGRLGIACPSVMATHLPVFIHPWLLKSLTVHEYGEKESAFLGLCEMIKVNPQAGLNHLDIIMSIISQWQHPSSNLNQEFEAILHGYKKLLPAEDWTNIYSSLPATCQNTLYTRYSL